MRYYWFLISLLILVSLSCSGGTSTAEPVAPAATEVSAPEAAATEAPATESGQSEVIFEEIFADNSNNWEVGAGESSQSVIEDGKLKVTSEPLDPTVYNFYTIPVSVNEADLSVDTEFTGGALENINYGFACQYLDQNNYIWVAIRPDGTFGISRILGGKAKNLTYRTNSSHVNQGIGAVNHLRAICREEHITLFINDAFVADVVVPFPISGGSFRLMTNSSLTDENDINPVGVSFSNLVVQKPEAWEPPTEILLSDSFDNNDNAFWNFVENDNASAQIVDGQMVVKVKEANYSYGFGPGQIRLTDIDMSFDVTFLEGTEGNVEFGALCRQTDPDNNYHFIINNDGSYLLTKQVNGATERLIDWTESSAIKTNVGETNRIRVICSGSRLELYANDQVLIKTQDTSLTSGLFRLEAGRYDDDDAPVSMAFDNLEVKHALASEPPAEVLLSDSFDNNDNEWALFEEPNYSSAQIQDGQMVLRLETATAVSWVGPGVDFSKVDLSFDVTLQEGAPSNAAFGAVCRVNNDGENFYAFHIKDGSYYLYKSVASTYETLVDWTASTAIKTGVGETNRLRVVCSGNNLEFYANDQLLVKTKDTSFTSGYFALYAERWSEDNALVSVAFDNVEVKPVLDTPTETLFYDSFNDNDEAWQFSEDEDGSVQILEKQLVMEIKKADYGYRTWPEFQLADVDMSFDITLKEGTPSNVYYGVMCRFVDNDNYYDFMLGSDGYYRLAKMVNGTYETLVDWTESTAIKQGTGETNRIRVVCTGSNLELYANGQLLILTQDTSLTKTGFALQAGSLSDDFTPVLITFDNVEILKTP